MGKLDLLTHQIIGAAMEVSNTLGCGFLEKVYERALLFELRARGFKALSQVRYRVVYKNYLAGEYFADLVVEDLVSVELKCVELIGASHVAQCLNYLKASRLEACLLFNFERPLLEWRRLSLLDPGWGAETVIHAVGEAAPNSLQVCAGS